MPHDDGLMIGMFWGGLLVASVPILLTLGVGVYVLRRYLEARREEPSQLERAPADGT
jgi:hypothetical protein